MHCAGLTNPNSAMTGLRGVMPWEKALEIHQQVLDLKRKLQNRRQSEGIWSLKYENAYIQPGPQPDDIFGGKWS